MRATFAAVRFWTALDANGSSGQRPRRIGSHSVAARLATGVTRPRLSRGQRIHPAKTWKTQEICIRRGDFDTVLKREGGQLCVGD